MHGSKIVVTGATGQVGLPVALALAKENEVVAPARFSDPNAKDTLEAGGVRCVTVDLGSGELDELPADADYVIHFAVARSGKFDRDIRDNCEATGLLMQHHRGAKAFIHCSSTAVYEPKDGPIKESDPLADNHRIMFPTYSIVKIATEAVVRTAARALGVPTVIARLNVPYGDNGGWPDWHVLMMQGGMDIAVQPGGRTPYNPIHEDDLIAFLPKLADAADTPAPIVNVGGDEVVSIEEWCAYLGELTGLEPKLAPTEATLPAVEIDTTKMHELLGHTSIPWRDGFRRMVETRHPELLAS